jgi:hypothetical protein
MNATSYAEFRSAIGQSSQANDEKMEQVRELLFGEHQRQSEARLAMLEARIRELELSLLRRLEALEGRMEQVASRVEADQRATLDELGRGISDLGERVRRLR